MSTLEVNTLDSVSGTSTLTIGGSNAGTIALGSGDVQSNFLNPAFEARLNSAQDIGDAVDTKIQYNNEIFDTDNCYDNSTNYRFTPTVAGKYFVYGYAYLDTQASSNFDQGRLYIFKNGSIYTQSTNNMGDNFPEAMTIQVQSIIDFNGSSDYVELYAWINDTSGTPRVRGDSTNKFAAFGAYRIGT
tara:strand:- start:24 stop:584 length:561 start_codon:yes stop_codon:yes gene_type:complete